MRRAFHSLTIVLFLGAGVQAADLAGITKRLISTDNRQREAAASEVAALSPEDQKQVAIRLTPLLKGADTDRREHAAEALQLLGPAAEPAIPSLQANLSDDFPYVRVRSAEALARIGPAAVPAFIEALKNDNNEVRIVTAQALARLGVEARPAISALVHALDDSENPVRQRAATALEHCGAEAAPTLIQALDDANFKNRIGVIKVLGAIDGTPANLPAQLTPFLSDPNPDVRLAAMKALTRKGSNAVSAVSLSLSSPSAQVREESADILADIGPEATAAVPLLISVLKDPDANVRAATAHALGKMRDAATPAIPSLRAALLDSDRDVAARAQEALTAITTTTGGPHDLKDTYVPSSGPEKAVTPPSVKSKPKPAAVRPTAKKPRPTAKAVQERIELSYLKLDSTGSIHALEMTAQKGNPEARTAALMALASLLQNADEKIRSNVAAALERVGTEDAKKILTPYLKQEELKKINRLMAEIQTSTGSIKEAVDSLAAMGPVVVPAVTKALKDPKPKVRLAGAEILTRLGHASLPAVPRLIESLDDPEENVRHQAAKALEVTNSPEAKNPLRWYSLKEKARPWLKKLHITI